MVKSKARQEREKASFPPSWELIRGVNWSGVERRCHQPRRGGNCVDWKWKTSVVGMRRMSVVG